MHILLDVFLALTAIAVFYYCCFHSQWQDCNSLRVSQHMTQSTVCISKQPVKRCGLQNSMLHLDHATPCEDKQLSEKTCPLKLNISTNPNLKKNNTKIQGS